MNFRQQVIIPLEVKQALDFEASERGMKPSKLGREILTEALKAQVSIIQKLKNKKNELS